MRYVVVIENSEGGYTCFGPFNTQEFAMDWALQELRSGYWVTQLLLPSV